MLASPRGALYLPAVNNYRTRAALVALAYFPETERDTEITVAPAPPPCPPTLPASRGPRRCHGRAVACFDEEKSKATHTRSDFFPFSTSGYATELRKRFCTFTVLVSLCECQLEAFGPRATSVCPGPTPLVTTVHFSLFWL